MYQPSSSAIAHQHNGSGGIMAWRNGIIIGISVISANSEISEKKASWRKHENNKATMAVA